MAVEITILEINVVAVRMLRENPEWAEARGRAQSVQLQLRKILQTQGDRDRYGGGDSGEKGKEKRQKG